MTVSMDRQNQGAYRSSELRIFVRDLRDAERKKRPITVRSWSTVKDVKDIIQRVIHVPSSAQKLYFGIVAELPNHRSLHDVGIYRSGETLLLDIQGGNRSAEAALVTSNTSDLCLSSSMLETAPKSLRSRINHARRGFALGLKPEFILDGSGGSYFLHDVRKNRIAVFKPADEEPYAENNPRKYLPQSGQMLSLRDGIRPGEACLREVAAYLLDHGSFSGVPKTTLVDARHAAFNTNGARLTVAEGGASVGAHALGNSPTRSPLVVKTGSFQEYIPYECTMDDISPTKLSVDEVQKIAILDIRLMNADRNSANLLIRRTPEDKLELVPIDHGYCLRSVCDVSWMDWCWLDWPQLKKVRCGFSCARYVCWSFLTLLVPQPLSNKAKEYIKKLDIEADVRLLQDLLNLDQDALDNFRASSLALKAGVEAGLTLYEIATVCCRNDNMGEVPSRLERLSGMASEIARTALLNDRWQPATASRALADQLSPQRITLTPRVKTDGFQRCASSGEMLTLAHQDSMLIHDLDQLTSSERNGSPSMAQSSSSDTSSTHTVDANLDQEECDEWAATVIADVTPEPLTSRRGYRAQSITSDDGTNDSLLSSSPKGFWTFPPTSSVAGMSDDGSTWSPKPERPSVTFAEYLPSKGPFIPPPTVSVTKMEPAVPRQESLSMSRSKSYSALNHNSSGLSASSQEFTTTRDTLCRKNSMHEDDENYRDYFLKFIDLAIVREMMSVSLQAGR